MNDFNFFTFYLHNQKKENIKKLSFYIMILILVSVFLIIPFLNFFHIKKISHQIENVNAEASHFSYKETKDIKNKKESIDSLNIHVKQLKNLESYVKDKDIINDCLLYTLKNMIPNNLFFQTIEMNPKEIKIKGFATTQRAIAQFQHNLEVTDCFEKIFVSNIENKGNYDFTLIFSIKEF